jgi:hypothetical protein
MELRETVNVNYAHTLAPLFPQQLNAFFSVGVMYKKFISLTTHYDGCLFGNMQHILYMTKKTKCHPRISRM